MSSIVGSDTTIYIENYGSMTLLIFDFTMLSNNAATLDVGYSNDRVSFCSANATVNGAAVTLPLTLSKVTYSKTANGYTRYRVQFEKAKWPGVYTAFKLTKNSATGTLSWDY